MSRGFFEIGIYHGKSSHNLGTLWRSAYQLGANGIFAVASRYPMRPASDTLASWRHIPHRRFESFDAFVEAVPYSTPIVAVEMGGRALGNYVHPERAMYLLGAEDHGLPPEILKRCHQHVSLAAVRVPSFNVAVAGSVVMYDRMAKAAA